MPIRRPSSVTALTRDDHEGDDDDRGLGPRPSSYAPVRPSMLLCDDAINANATNAELTRPRSLSAESDANKPRTSVPLLYASAVSSMSTLSSTFYQYDSTEGAPTPIPTPSSYVSSSDAPRRKHTTVNPDPPMRLPAAQERALVADATRMTTELIIEHLRALVTNSKRAAITRHAPSGVMVASSHDMRIFAHNPLGAGNTGSKFAKRPKRYVAQWQVNATLEEVVALLRRDEDRRDVFNSYQSVLHPETVHCKTLWKGVGGKAQSSSVPLTMDDRYDSDEEVDDDAEDSFFDPDGGVMSVDINDVDDDEDLLFFSDRGRGTRQRMTSVASHRSMNSTTVAATSRPRTETSRRRAPTSRRRLSSSPPCASWLGINWWVQHMPGKLSRDRDLVVLEKQCAFVTSTSNPRRGFVHMQHSVDMADVSRGLMSPFVRAFVTQSGLVVVESDEPGVIELSQSMEIDFAGHLGAGQHRQIVIKRLLQLDKVNELLWKTRVLKSQLLWTPTKPVEKQWLQCDRCQVRGNRFTRKALAPCKVCVRVVCNNCSQVWDFLPLMVEEASLRGRPVETENDGTLRARVCAHCVQEHSRPPRQYVRSQPAMSVDVRSTVRESEYSQADDAGRLPDTMDPTPMASHLYRPTSKRAETWEPSRSSRVAEELVDDFLLSLSPATEQVMPKPSLSSHVPIYAQPPPPAKPRPASRSSVTPYLDSDDLPPSSGPRRKLSLFELIPEPAPRKNVVLYEC